MYFLPSLVFISVLSNLIPLYFLYKYLIKEAILFVLKYFYATLVTNNDKIILIEELENHLSYSNMNNLIDILQENSNKKSSQIIISTHSSFVLNKLGLENLILLSNTFIKQKKL
ncbi:AAA family ATPase [Macrococcoides canis]|uniref:AAA family ATPase n=1 Tax=Macrococcoides canis TaxID=1855823 RepID=UPI0039C99F94